VTPRPRTIRAAIIARTNLRDRAAAAEARAQSENTEAAAALERATAELDRAMLSAGARMATSQSVTELARIVDELDAEKAAVVDARREREVAGVALRSAIDDLRRSERQLRTVERALDASNEQRAVEAARDEQRLTDDLGSRRRS
jgi:hypothetical protein